MSEATDRDRLLAGSVRSLAEVFAGVQAMLDAPIDQLRRLAELVDPDAPKMGNPCPRCGRMTGGEVCGSCRLDDEAARQP